ncbi:MAG: phosphonopyruvate decarboxylase [Myxococcota bacterium]|nr:phosphonopyruvate decarboxylase [Myxococcota bacterium]
MLEPRALIRLFGDAGIHSYTGVPCSYLKSLITELGQEDGYVAAASEGEAIGIGVGSALAGTGAAVLLQSSGLGNCVNPLTSLVAPFEIPILLIVGYRNSDGHGPPQHTMMGAITEPLLDLLNIHHVTLEPDLATARGQVQGLLEHSRATRRAVALLVREKSFSSPSKGSTSPSARPASCESIQVDSAEQPPVSRAQALETIVGGLNDSDVVIATTGMTSRELFALADRPANFYMVGSMGCALAIGLGIARAAVGRRVVVVDGDGALLMKLGTLATVGHYGPSNLVHIVLDNGTYESTGSQPTTASSVSFPGMAKSAGYRKVMTARVPGDLKLGLDGLGIEDGPSLLHLPISDGHMDGVGRVSSDLPKLALRLMDTLKESRCADG